MARELFMTIYNNKLLESVLKIQEVSEKWESIVDFIKTVKK